MQKYKKFIFQELPKDAVVNIHDNSIDNNQDEIINIAVTQHLQTIVNDESSSNEEDIIEESVLEGRVNYTEQEIDQIKSESYTQGVEETKAHYESIIANMNFDNDFSALVKEKLSLVKPSFDVATQLSESFADIVLAITQKLHLVLPVDFKEIISVELLNIVKKSYKSGNIKIEVNQSRFDLCNEILKLENLPEDFKENIKVAVNPELEINDCAIFWEDSCVKFDYDNLYEEAIQFVNQFKSEAIA